MDDAREPGFVVTWRALLRVAAWSAVVEYALVLFTAKQLIPPVFVIGVVILVGAVLLKRPGRTGIVVTLVGLVLFFASNLAFALADLGEYRSFPSFAIASAAFVSGVVGIVAAVAALRRDGESHVARTIALGAAAAAVGLVVVNVIATVTYTDARVRIGDAALVAKDVKFSAATMTVRAGRVSFYVKNRDAVLHNFHLKGIGTLSVPASHAARATFTIPAGTYTYVCDYHPDDMKGTLTSS
jgi:plastocyanin